MFWNIRSKPVPTFSVVPWSPDVEILVTVAHRRVVTEYYTPLFKGTSAVELSILLEEMQQMMSAAGELFTADRRIMSVVGTGETA